MTTINDEEFRDVRRWRNEPTTIRQIMLERAEFELEWAKRHGYPEDQLQRIQDRIDKLGDKNERL